VDTYLKELSLEDGQDIFQMLQEIGKGENGFTNSIPTSSFEGFSRSLTIFINNSKGIDLPEQHVPQTIYWLFVNAKPVGLGKLRHHLNDRLREYGGNIGYLIRPTERGKGYRTLLLTKLINEAKTKEMNEVLITCDEDNLRSRRVIEGNNGLLAELGNGVCKYWIKLKDLDV
jgi:predicted acetyltransferase